MFFRLSLITLLGVWLLSVILPPLAVFSADLQLVETTAMSGEEDSEQNWEKDYFELEEFNENEAAVSIYCTGKNNSLSYLFHKPVPEVPKKIELPPPELG